MRRFFGPLLIISSLAGAQNPPPLFVVIGGYRSCNEKAVFPPFVLGSELNQSFGTFKKNIEAETGQTIHWVTSCIADPGFSILNFRFSAEGMPKPGDAEFKDPFVDALDPFVAAIKEAANKWGTQSLYIIGHSYGGWSAMQVALKLADTYNIKGLTTIDPISPLACSPKTLATFELVEGCRQAPADLTDAQRKKLHESVGVWSFFYQTQFHRLHSSPYQEPHMVQKVVMAPTSQLYNDQHTAISADPRIWDAMQKQMTAYIKGTSRR